MNEAAADQNRAEKSVKKKEELVSAVKDHYGRIASGGSCCAPSTSCCGTETAPVSAGLGYDSKELREVPGGADMGLGCGAPVASLKLKRGETVLDLGSGGGLDAFLAAREVGPSGKVIGVDMTPAMLERARDNARKGGYGNVEFREGRLERLPVDDASVDAVTSNCVINLVPDKRAVFAEIARVLRRGGRVAISDIVLEGRLPEALEQEITAYAGCISGAELRQEYLAIIKEAGLGRIEILKDQDIIACSCTAEDSLSSEAKALLERTGVKLEDVMGKVHSITFRAVKE